ncbi:MAG: Ig-like domain-containing protein [Saprospiraceae bacterium]
MKTRFLLFTAMICCIFLTQKLDAQVSSVNYRLKYNADSCRYDAYIVINSGTATTTAQKTQFNAQYTIVLPQSDSIVADSITSYAPFVATAAGLSTDPMRWKISTQVKAPAAAPNNRFYSITPSIPPTSRYSADLGPGDEILIFSFKVSNITSCGDFIRIWDNDLDPDSGDSGMQGSDYDNGFTLGGNTQLYNANSTQVQPPLPVLVGATTSCAGGIEIDLTATTGTCQTPLTYSWTSNSTNNYISTNEDVSIVPSTLDDVGDYKVVVTDALGCKDSLTISATNKPDAGVDQTACAGSIDTIQGANPITGTWSALGTNPAGATLGAQPAGAALVTFSNAASGTYSFIYSTPSCSDTMNIVVTAKPTVSSPVSILCIGSTTTLVSDSIGTWVSNSPSIASVNASTGLVTALAQGSATFTFTQTSTGCSSTTSPITVNPKPPVSVTGNPAVCIGSTTTLSPTTGGTWLDVFPGIATVNPSTGLVTGVSAGTGRFVFTETLTGCKSDTINVIVTPKPTITLTGPASICVFATTTFTPDTLGTWHSTNATVATISNSGVVTGLSGGTSRFIWTQTSTGCKSDTSAVITVIARPTVSLLNAVRCVGATTSLSANKVGTWVSNNTSVATVLDSTVTAVSQGLATFTFTETATGCQNTTTGLTVNPKPTVLVAANPICIGSSTTLSPSSGGTWSQVAGGTGTLTLVSNTVTGLTAGTKTVRFTETASTCTNDTTITITPSPVVSITGANSICVGFTTQLSPNSGGTWASSNLSVASVSNTGLVTGLSVGSATFTFTLTGSCSSLPTAPVTIKNKPVVSISGSNAICIGATTTLSVSPITGGTWTSNNPSVATVNSSTGLVTAVSAGSATFYFTETTGCVSDNTAPVTVNTPPTVSFTGPSVICAGFTTTLSPTTGGTWASSDTLIAKVNNAGLVTGVSAGPVTFTFTQTSSGCVSSALQGRVSAKPIVNITGSSPICIDSTTSVSSDSTGTWVSSAPSVATITNGGLITGISQGTAIFTFTSTAGCAADPIISIAILPRPTVTVSGPTSICIAGTTTLTPTTGGTWTSNDPSIATVNSSSGVVTGVAAGSVTFVFTSTSGCVSLPTAPVTVNPKPIIVVNGASSICVGSTTNVSPATGGSWQSSNSAIATVTNAGLITGITPGSVTFTYTQSSTNCASNPSSPITITPGPVANLGPDTTLCIGATTTLSPNSGGTWTSSNTAVATINATTALVTAVSQGSVTFRFRLSSTGCLSAPTSPITVNGRPTVSISGTTNICIGGTTQLSPSTGGTWISNSPAIASVTDEGIVTGEAAGSATFTFTLTGGCVSLPTLPVTVTAAPVISFSGPTAICVGGSTTLSPSSGGVWVSSDPSIATINPNTGVVTSFAPGKVTFRFTETATGCASETWSDTLTITHCFNPDFNATFVNVSVPGDVNTNDNVDPASTYGPTPVEISKPSGGIYTLTMNSDGTYTFIADKEGVYRFEVPVCIPPLVSGCPRSDLTITVRNNISPDPLPVANVDIASTPRDSSVTLRTLSNDRCVQITGCSLDPATVTITINPSHGGATVDSGTGDITYTPTTGYIGMDTLTYQVCVSGGSPCTTAKQIITVNAPTAPNSTIAADDFAVTPQNTAVSGDVKTNDSDPEGDTQTVTAQTTTSTGIGTLVLITDGTYTFTPVDGFYGPVEFVYETIDDNASPDTAYATLHILVMQDLTLKVRVYLEGALLNNANALAGDGRPMMRDNLRFSPFTSTRYIPDTDPYRQFSGTVNVVSKFIKVAPGDRTEFLTIPNPTSVFAISGQEAIVDWVFVELRSKSSNITVLATRSGLLQRDGDVVDLDGVSGLRFPGIPMDDYYVVVRHHSHLGAMTAIAQTPTELTTLVNFTSTAKAMWDYGSSHPLSVGFNFTGLSQNTVVKSGISYRALWAGDFDANGKIKNDNPSDDLNYLSVNVLSYYNPNATVSTPSNTGFTSNFDFAYGYLQGDFDMNSKAKFDNPNDDKNMLYGQLLFYPLNTLLLSNFDHFREQLPKP